MENQTISMILGFQPKIYHLLRYNPSRTWSVPPQKPIAPPKPIALNPTDKNDRPPKPKTDRPSTPPKNDRPPPP
jgi:hypothetical protein